MGYRLGIDLGTTFTAAAVGNGQPPEMLGLGNRALQIPSVLFLTEDGQFLVGEAAERRGLVDPSRLVREFKRRIGDPVPVLVAGTPYSPQALTARLLAWVVASATERRGAAPDEVVLTHPANWGDYKRELLDQVLAMADVGAARTCPEPQAAAIQYAARARLDPGARVAVYDLGGGTFDVCVLEKTADGFTILGSPDGVEHLGGVDFDEAVFQHVIGVLGTALDGLDPNDTTVKVALTRLRRDCVEAKEALSADVETVVPVALPGRSASVRLTRSELEGLIGPSLQDTIAATSRALRAADTTSGQLSAIVLVGGSSRIPMVSHLLQSTFATTTSLDTHPKHDIALGAVQFGSAEPVARPAAVGAPAAGRSGPPPPSAAPAATPADARAATPAETPAGPPAEAPAEAPAGRSPLSGRRRWIAAAAAAAVAAASVTAVLLLTRDENPVSAEPGAVIAQSPSPSPSRSVPVLPRAATPLAAAHLLVPLEDRTKQSGLDIYRADATDPSVRVRITTAEGIETTPALSPDRRTMIYTHVAKDGKATLLVSGVDGRGTRPLFATMPAQCAGGASRPGWNPRNPEVLVMTCRAKAAGDRSVFTVNLVDLRGTVLRTLDTVAGPAKAGDAFGDPTFAPDGSRVAYWALRDGQSGIYVTPATGLGEPRRLTTGLDADPAWSPAGDGRLAYRHALSSGVAAIVVTDVDGAAVACGGSSEDNPVGGGQLCRITDGKDFDQDPSWSADGKEIAFKAGRNFGATSDAVIEIVPADGSSPPRQVWTADPGTQAAPAWTTR